MKILLLRIKLFIFTLLGKIKVILPIGIEVVNKIKQFTDSPVTDIITFLIPGGLDNRIVTLLRKYLPLVLLQMEDGNEFINMTTNEKLKASNLKINGYNPTKRNFLNLGIASTLNMLISNDSMTQSESIIATQYAYDNNTIVG